MEVFQKYIWTRGFQKIFGVHFFIPNRVEPLGGHERNSANVFFYSEQAAKPVQVREQTQTTRNPCSACSGSYGHTKPTELEQKSKQIISFYSCSLQVCYGQTKQTLIRNKEMHP